MENLQVTLRKHQHTLAVMGMGVIGFCVWGVVKSFFYVTFVHPLNDALSISLDNVTDTELERVIAFAITAGFIAIINLIDLIFRWSIGRRAIAIARGESKPSAGFYMRTSFVTLVDAIECVAGIWSVVSTFPSGMDLTDRISTLLVDATSVIMLIEMISASVMIGKITKRIEADNAD